MAKPIHIHKVKRKTYKTGNSVYFCTLPDCFFKVAVEFALGKQFLCNRCGLPFTMNQYSLRLAKPHCENCHGNRSLTYDGPERREIPTRRELDPSVIAQIPDATIDSLKNKLEGKIIYQEMPVDDEDNLL